MIQWIISFAYAEIGILSSFFGVFIVGICVFACCTDIYGEPNVAIPFILFVLQAIASLAVQITYVVMAVPIRDKVGTLCSSITQANSTQVNSTTLDMCTFYSTSFNPIVIMLIVLLSFSCLNFLFFCVFGLIMWLIEVD